MITQAGKSLYENCIAEYEMKSTLDFLSQPEFLQEIRRQAFTQFKRSGFPTTKIEDWKYTNLSPFLNQDMGFDTGEEIPAGIEKLLNACIIGGLDAHRVVLVNGKFIAELSTVQANPVLIICGIESAFGKNGFKNHFSKYAPLHADAFVSLNTAMFNNGFYLEVKHNSVIPKPVHVIHVTSTGSAALLHPRNLILVGSNAEVSLVESFIDAGDNRFINNQVSEIVLGENAKLAHYYLQSGTEQAHYVHHTEIHQQSNSVYNNYKASFPGTALLRNNISVVLNGQNVESHLYGIYLAGGKQLVDNHTLVDHRMPNCQSNELYKGVMNDEATGVFNGKIYVRKDAQKTNAFQQNNNLMLSKKAVIDSKPQLEILADDVKCSHGTTVGQFNEEALFYLKSRGIGDERARTLLIHAFAFDVTEKIPLVPVQQFINHLVEEALQVN